MTNGNNAAQAKHLESTAAATKRFILAAILDVANAVAAELANVSGGGVLDTVASTVDGGMWYEVESNIPTAVKLKHGAHTLTLTPEINNISPQLTVTPSALNIAAGGSITAGVSRLGTGAVTVSSNESSVVPTYSNGTITVPYSYSAATAVITVSVAASYGFLADSTTFTVTMGTTSPNLTVTPSASSISVGGTVMAAVSYDGVGALSVESDNASVTPTISGSMITLPFVVFDEDTDVTFTVSVTQKDDYISEEKTFTVTYISPCVVNMPFTTSATQDLCGNTWTAYGRTPIYDNELYLAGTGNYLRSTSIVLGGKSFTIEFFNTQRDSVGWHTTLHIEGFSSGVIGYRSNYEQFVPQYNDNYVLVQGVFSRNSAQQYHSSIVYDYSAKEIYWFINGVLKHTHKSITLDRSTLTITIGNGFGYGYIGEIDDFKIYDGVALHTANFTPPARSS